MNTNKEHNEELNIPKTSGFEVPQGYFSSVEDDFSTRLKEDQFPNNSGFKVPEGYFDSLEDTLLEKVAEPKKGKVISLRTRMLRVASIAAVFVFVFISIWNRPTTDEELSSEEIAAWLNTNIGDISEDDITYELDDDVEFTEVDLLESSIENNSIDSYFNQNDTYILIEESQGLFDEIN